MLLPNAWLVIVIVLLLGLLFEVLAVLIGKGPSRRVPVYISIVLNGFGSGLLLTEAFGIMSAVIVVCTMYRTINMMRFVAGRLHEDYVGIAVARTWLKIILLQFGILLVWFVWRVLGMHEYADKLHAIVAALVAGICILILFNTIIRMPRKSQYVDTAKLKSYPTVSVLIPARNETQDLPACIEMVLANDYPKLEVLVLDDCSQDNTPDIIKKFAHTGVRFIPGENPKTNWLAKNQAYARLSKEATGELLLFMGVDVRLHQKSIYELVALMQHRKLTMLSVMPRRGGQRLLGMLVQPMRYWWELSLPKQLFKIPPVLSTVWMIDAATFRKSGGMAAVSRSVLPEAYFARKANDLKEYAFISATNQLPVETLKSVHEQVDTAIRTRYPQVKREPFNVLLVAFFEVAALLVPLMYVLLGLAAGEYQTLWWLALVASTAYGLSHVLIAKLSNPGLWLISIVAWPIITVVELILLHLSMLRYEFGDVNWKERNICLPVMQVIPKLPKLP